METGGTCPAVSFGQGVRGPTRWGNQLNGNREINSVFSVPFYTGPTRWGNQLNGNNFPVLSVINWEGRWPHSLGQSVEWKL